MALPNVNMTIRDGGLGIVPNGAGNVHCKIGAAPQGVVNTIYSVTDQTTLTAALGKGGPLTEAAALALAVGAQAAVRPGGLLLIPANPSTYGSASGVTQVGAGACAVTVSVKPHAAFQIKCIVGGSATTSTWQTSLDAGATYGATWTAAATILVPGVSFTTLAFGAGNSVAGDVVTVTTAGVTALASGTGNLVPTLSTACPVDAYSVVITITTTGGRGAGFFTISLDGGNTTGGGAVPSGPILIPSSGNYTVADTGLLVAFSNASATAGDTYSFTTTTASYSNTDLTNAFNILIADPRLAAFVHVVGPASSAVNSATQLASFDTLLGTALTSNRPMRGAIEVFNDTDANILSAFVAAASTRVNAIAGYHTYTSPLNARQQSRPIAYSVLARASSIPTFEALGKVDTGSLPGVLKLARDESATPGLDAGRFTTCTTIAGRNGFFITGLGRLFAQAGSDFTFWPYGRVMDQITFYARLAFLKFLNASVRVNADGTIADKDARAIEAYADQYIRNAIQPGSISDLQVSVSRTNNVLSTQTIAPTVRATPLGYASNINVDLGFQNSALQVKAA